METSYLKTLELDKIVARAAEGCVCKEAREMLLATQPQCDPDEVRYALEQTDAINTLLIKNGSPRFGGVENVSQLAARAVKGGVLSMGELLMVAGALRNFQNLSSWYGASEHDALPTDDLFYALAPQPGLEQQISSAILAPDAMADTASYTLNDLRKKIRATENSIRDNNSRWLVYSRVITITPVVETRNVTIEESLPLQGYSCTSAEKCSDRPKIAIRPLLNDQKKKAPGEPGTFPKGVVNKLVKNPNQSQIGRAHV